MTSVKSKPLIRQICHIQGQECAISSILILYLSVCENRPFNSEMNFRDAELVFVIVAN